MINGKCHCGSVTWELDFVPDTATACNCSVCSRYGTLWAYAAENESARVTGATHVYTPGSYLGFHFCQSCGCVAYWRALNPDDDNQRRIALNLRLADYKTVAKIPVRPFDGLDSFKALASDGRCVASYWT